MNFSDDLRRMKMLLAEQDIDAKKVTELGDTIKPLAVQLDKDIAQEFGFCNTLRRTFSSYRDLAARHDKAQERLRGILPSG